MSSQDTQWYKLQYPECFVNEEQRMIQQSVADFVDKEIMPVRELIDDDVTHENGPLKVIPGSHVSSTSEGLGVDRAVTIHATAGDVLAMRPLITHASGASETGTKRHRRILHLEFAPDPVLPDGFQWHDYVSINSQGIAVGESLRDS